MAINHIQFQKGLSLAKFLQAYGTEEQCTVALAQARWPQGFVCARCQHGLAYVFKRQGQTYWQCKACQHQTSVRAGTAMAHSRLPLTTWYLAMYWITHSKTSIAALALRRHLGVSWKAAWLLKHKLMEVMFQREAARPLHGDVRIDDAYLGGERTGGGRGRGSVNKVPFVVAVEMRDARPQRLRFDVVTGFSMAALTPWAKQALAPGACVISDGLPGFAVLDKLGYQHTVQHPPHGKAGTEIQAFRWLNVVLGNLKTALSGTYHAFKFAKYGFRYLAEVQYRFNRRLDLAAMLPRMATAVMQARPCCRQQIVGLSEPGT